MTTLIPARDFTADQANAMVGWGAALLDDIAPGWHDVLDLGRLDLRSTHSCVLGQAAGHIYDSYGTSLAEFYGFDEYQSGGRPEYTEAAELITAHTDDFSPAECGFDYPHYLFETRYDYTPSRDRDRVWEMLTCAWVNAAAVRRMLDDPWGEPPYVQAELERQPALLATC